MVAFAKLLKGIQMAKRTIVQFYGRNVSITDMGDGNYELEDEVYTLQELTTIRDLVNEIISDYSGSPITTVTELPRRVEEVAPAPQPQPQNTMWHSMVMKPSSDGPT